MLPGELPRRVLLDLAAADKSDFQATLERILRADASALGIERVGFWSLRPDRFSIVCEASYLAGPDRLERGQELSGRDYPTYFLALDRDPLIVADDARTDPRTREFKESYLEPLGITSMLDVPVWVGGALAGVLCHEHVGAPRRFSDAEEELALSMGNILSSALEARARAEAEQTLKEREAHLHALAEGMAEAQAALRARDDTLAIVSHDLRQPLTAIQTNAALALHDLPPEAKTRRRVEAIDRSVRQMNRLISDLVDASRLEAGATPRLDRSPQELDRIAVEAIEEMREAATARSLGLVVALSAPGQYADCDRGRILQVLANLLGNAVKYTPPGGRVELRSRRVPGGVRLSVRDSGPGIAPDDLPRVFDRYFRAPHAGGEGLGLGLFIARGIIEAHGGTLEAESRPGAGATFSFTLPCCSERADGLT